MPGGHGDGGHGHICIVDQRNVMQPNLSHSWIQWTTGHGHSDPRKQSISIVHYWVRHAKCTWSSWLIPSVSSSTNSTIWILRNSLKCHHTSLKTLKRVKSLKWYSSGKFYYLSLSRPRPENTAELRESMISRAFVWIALYCNGMYKETKTKMISFV